MIASRSPFLRSLLLLSACCGGVVQQAAAGPETWEPAGGVVPAGGFVVDPTSRIESLSFYNTVFLASEGAENRIQWTGSYGACTPGTTNALFQEDVRRRVNYYRAICGLPAAISFGADPAPNDGPAGSPAVPANTSKHSCAQASAYMNAFSDVFYDSNLLSHTPTAAASVCWSNKAWNGSYHGNLTVGFFGPRAIDVYMADDGQGDDQANNVNVGHRRWILYSRAKDMATGDVPRGTYTDGSGSYPVLPSNTLYVLGVFNSAASSPKQFVTWPPRGYVPAPLKPLRWSISYPGAVFPSAASAITVTGPTGNVIPVTVLSANQNNFGDNTLVFQPQQTALQGTADTAFNVTVTGITGSGVPASFTWQTIFFDPTVLGISQNLTGPVQPPAAGADYQFSAAPLASSYQIQAAQPAAPATWLQNGETAPLEFTSDTTGTYPVLQGAGSLSGIGFTPRSGSKSFHLCFPLDESEVDYLPHNQSFSLNGEFIPEPTSSLQFHEYFRWLFSVNRLSAEISTDGGNQWTEIYGRNGSYGYAPGASYTNTSWDGAWHLRTISLAQWAGQPLRLRFILRPGSVSFDGPDINHGCYLDDITLTNVRRLTASAVVTQSSTSFTLNSQLTGGNLIPGNPYLLRVRSQIGTRFMGYSAALTVVPLPPGGFETAFPALASQPQADADADGIANFVEYAFGLNPLTANSTLALPQPVLTPAGLTLDFTTPASVTDVNYTAECTSDFLQWLPVPNQGSGSQRSFTVPITPGQNCFMRLRVNQQ